MVNKRSVRLQGRVSKIETGERELLVQLRNVAHGLRELSKMTGQEMGRRDRLVEQLRQRGVSWGRIATAAGVTRAALLYRRRSVGGVSDE